MSAPAWATAPFLITTTLADNSVVRIPAADFGELDRILERMSETCASAGVPAPATVVWRVDREEPRPMTSAELEEGGLHGLPILAA